MLGFRAQGLGFWDLSKVLALEGWEGGWALGFASLCLGVS